MGFYASQAPSLNLYCQYICQYLCRLDIYLGIYLWYWNFLKFKDVRCMLCKPLHNDSASEFHYYKLYPICLLYSSYTKKIYKHKALRFKVSKAAQLSRGYVWVMYSPVDINVFPENPREPWKIKSVSWVPSQ